MVPSPGSCVLRARGRWLLRRRGRRRLAPGRRRLGRRTPRRPTRDAERLADGPGPARAADRRRTRAAVRPERRRARPAGAVRAPSHGASGHAEGGFRIWAPFAERSGTILLAPQSTHGGAWDVMVGGFGSDAAMIDEALRWVFERFSIDPSHLAVAGFLERRHVLAVARADERRPVQPRRRAAAGSMLAGSLRRRPPVFVAHGLQDRVLPIDQTSRAIVPELRKKGYDVTFATFDAVHHLEPTIARRALRWFLGRDEQGPTGLIGQARTISVETSRESRSTYRPSDCSRRPSHGRAGEPHLSVLPLGAEIGAAEPRFAEAHDASVGPAFRLGETSTGRA